MIGIPNQRFFFAVISYSWKIFDPFSFHFAAEMLQFCTVQIPQISTFDWLLFLISMFPYTLMLKTQYKLYDSFLIENHIRWKQILIPFYSVILLNRKINLSSNVHYIQNGGRIQRTIWEKFVISTVIIVMNCFRGIRWYTYSFAAKKTL